MNQPHVTPVVLTIAGFDPSSGAGVTADIKTIARHGCYAVACVTALTIQTTRGVAAVHPVAAEVVRRTLQELAADFPLAAVRVGMLGSAEVAAAVADFLQEAKPGPVVLDPVLRSSSGRELLEAPGFEVLRSRLLPLAEVVTPNLEEAAALTGLEVSDLAGMRRAGLRLLELGAGAAVVTGGHLAQPTDVLVTRAGVVELAGERIVGRASHGTGCAFASALACNRALGHDLRAAVENARRFVREALLSAPTVGSGEHGPVI